MIAKPPEDPRVQLERLDVDASVWMKGVSADSTVRGDIGILLADGLAEHVDLDLACRLSARARRDRGPSRIGETLEQAHGVGAGGAHPGARGHIGDRGDLQRAAAPVAEQRLAQDRVADLADLVDLLEL